MHINEIFNHYSNTLSFEFSPATTDKVADIAFENIKGLEPLKPSFVSVTYGAGGSTQDRTVELIMKLKEHTKLDIVPHLTCVGQSKNEIYGILKKYDEADIDNVMALRGDPPQGTKNFTPHPDGFKYAHELVAFIKKNFPRFGIGVAGFPEGHPETPNRLVEMDYLKQKVDAGADYICTQLFFDNSDFYDYQERCELAKIEIPILAGIMPITSLANLHRIAELAAGSRIPAKLLKSLQRAESKELIEKVGIHWASEQVRDLLDNNVKGIHLYTLNRSNATKKIYESVGLKNSDSFRK